MKNKILSEINSARKAGDRIALAAFQGVYSSLNTQEARGTVITDAIVMKTITKEMNDYSENIRTCGTNEEALARFAVLKHFSESFAPAVISENIYQTLIANFLKEKGITKKEEFGTAMKLLKEKYGISLDYSKVSVILKSHLS